MMTSVKKNGYLSIKNLDAVSAVGLLMLGMIFVSPIKSYAQEHKIQTNKTQSNLMLIQRNILQRPNLESNFKQTYHSAIGQKVHSEGRLRYAQGGKIRWDYAGSNPKSYIVSEQTLWVASPAEGIVLENTCFASDQLSASLSFLWGDGKLNDRFDVAPFDGQFGEKDDIHLALTPKTASPHYARLILVASPKDGRVKQSIVVDHTGGINQFEFTEAKQLAQNANPFTLNDFKALRVEKMPGACPERTAEATPQKPKP